jgi:hypothetical protein
VSTQEKDSAEKRGNTPEPNRRRDTRTGSMTSQTSRSNLEESYSAADIKKQDALAALTQNFCPVTLTVNVFFKQVTCILSVWFLKSQRVGRESANCFVFDIFWGWGLFYYSLHIPCA